MSALCQCGCGGYAPLATRTFKARGWVKGEPLKFIHGHNKRSTDDRARFESKIGSREDCWIWIGALDGHGYGDFRTCGKWIGAHRFSYELYVGPIPKGLVIDHLCRNPRCVNPEHLEPVTMAENTARGIGQSARNSAKTHCIHGHEFSPENTGRDGRGRRICKACLSARNRKSYAARTKGVTA